MSRIDNKLIFLVYKEFFSLASYSRVMDTHFVGEIHKTNHSHWKFLFYYLKCITSRLVTHSSIHCTRDRNSSFQIPNYTKPAQIEAVKMITYIFFGHLQALCSNIKVMKANKLRITTQCTNCENHMADQDHMTHTTGVQRGQGQQTVIYTPPSYVCKIERFLINIVYFKNYQPAIKKLGNNCLICLYTNNLSHSQSFTIPGTCSDGVAIFGGCAEQLQLRGILQSSWDFCGWYFVIH